MLCTIVELAAIVFSSSPLEEEEELTLDDLILPADGMTVGELSEKIRSLEMSS